MNWKKTVSALMLSFLTISCISDDALARAGGGSSSGYYIGYTSPYYKCRPTPEDPCIDGDTLDEQIVIVVASILLILLIIWFFIWLPGEYLSRLIKYSPKKLDRLITERAQVNSRLLKQLAIEDDVWDLDSIKERIEKTYLMVHKVLIKRDITIAQNYMSTKLYSQHKIRIQRKQQSIPRGKMWNIKKGVQLNRVCVFHVSASTKQEYFWAQVKVSKIDALRGNHAAAPSILYTEALRFIRSSKGWVLDEIIQSDKTTHRRRLMEFVL